MPTHSFARKRGELETYFDRTAFDAWKTLTTDAPVSRIRATVRAGRDRMRARLLAMLPADLTGRRILDAGCGTGALAAAAAERGAEVVAIDVSQNLIDIARERAPQDLRSGAITFAVGDMLDAGLGTFDHVVAMDSLIHYRAHDMATALESLAARTRGSIAFTFAPRTPALTAMHTVGRLFPNSERAPAIEPVGERRIQRMLAARLEPIGWRLGESERVISGFYTSQAQELVRS